MRFEREGEKLLEFREFTSVGDDLVRIPCGKQPPARLAVQRGAVEGLRAAFFVMPSLRLMSLSVFE